ncbi:MAG: hypothetical protein QM811_10210 [Pirellulales bacterium]
MSERIRCCAIATSAIVILIFSGNHAMSVDDVTSDVITEFMRSSETLHKIKDHGVNSRDVNAFAREFVERYGDTALPLLLSEPISEHHNFWYAVILHLSDDPAAMRRLEEWYRVTGYYPYLIEQAGYLPEHRARTVFHRFLEIATDKNLKSKRTAILDALETFGNADTVRVVEEILKQDPDDESRAMLVTFLKQHRAKLEQKVPFTFKALERRRYDIIYWQMRHDSFEWKKQVTHNANLAIARILKNTASR